MEHLAHIFLAPISMSAVNPSFYCSPWKGILHRAKMLGPVRQQRKAEVTGEGSAPGGASEQCAIFPPAASQLFAGPQTLQCMQHSASMCNKGRASILVK